MPAVHMGTIIAVGLSDAEAEAVGGFRRDGEVGMYFKATPQVTFPDGVPVIKVVQVLKAETRALLEFFKPQLEKVSAHRA
jgi:hypothetical protein